MLTELSASPTHGGAAGAGPRLFIHRAGRGTDQRPGDPLGGRLGERLGEARILFPRIVQVLPPLDLRFGTIATRAADLVVCFDGSATPVRVSALCPALLQFHEAAELAERNGSGGLFATTSKWMVALELATAVPLPTYAQTTALGSPLDASQPTSTVPGPPAPGHPAPLPGPTAPPDGRPWWCKVFCLSGCGSC